WGYHLLRAALHKYMHSPRRREQPVSSPVSPEKPNDSRTATSPWLKTDVKDGFIELRETLDANDQIVLLLRINQKMAWTEIARIMDDGEAPMTEDVVRRKAAALRQNFHRIKDQLRKLAVERGLIPPEV
ncbi:MAG TPA: sigma-70 family RNA polymerase sigma factor, partial [Myxococcaceae bacterium]